MKTILLFLSLFLPLFSAGLHSSYSIDGLEVNASLIDPTIKKDFVIYTFEPNKHRKSISSKKVINLFKEHEQEIKDESRGIINFERVSSFDLSPIQDKIKSYYLEHYPSMIIEKIELQPNSFLQRLPSSYELKFKPKAYLYNNSDVHLDSEKTKEKLFLHYHVHAKVKLFKASHNINRGKILRHIDLYQKTEDFVRLKGEPFKGLQTRQVRLKKRLNKDKTVYEHDIEPLPLVLKNATVYVRYHSGNVHLEFQAKSLQDAKLGETINIQKKDKTRLKAVVIGPNLVEIK